MKKFAIVALAAVVLNALPALAQENPQEKYRCDVQAGNCVKRIDTIRLKMKKVESEIKKGNKGYTAEELNQIEQKLKEVDQLLDKLKAKTK